MRDTQVAGSHGKPPHSTSAPSGPAPAPDPRASCPSAAAAAAPICSSLWCDPMVQRLLTLPVVRPACSTQACGCVEGHVSRHSRGRSMQCVSMDMGPPGQALLAVGHVQYREGLEAIKKLLYAGAHAHESCGTAVTTGLQCCTTPMLAPMPGVVLPALQPHAAPTARPRSPRTHRARCRRPGRRPHPSLRWSCSLPGRTLRWCNLRLCADLSAPSDQPAGCAAAAPGAPAAAREPGRRRRRCWPRLLRRPTSRASLRWLLAPQALGGPQAQPASLQLQEGSYFGFTKGVHWRCSGAREALQSEAPAPRGPTATPPPPAPRPREHGHTWRTQKAHPTCRSSRPPTPSQLKPFLKTPGLCYV